MKAAYYDAFAKPLTLSHLPDPRPEADGVVVRVAANGICRSDWHGWMGHDPDIKLPHVPGHELAGTVAEAGRDVRRWRPGDRVTVPFVGGCGRCPQSASGNQQVCDHQFQAGFTHWGSFAQYVAIGYANVNLVRLPDQLDFTTAASLGCRFATSFRTIVAQGRVCAGQWVAVHGCGGVGLSAILIASALGTRVVAIDIAEEKLAFARSIGAEATVNAAETREVAQAVMDITQGGAHVSIDALGQPGDVLQLDSRAYASAGSTCRSGCWWLARARRPCRWTEWSPANSKSSAATACTAHAYDRMLAMIVAGRLRPDLLIGKTVSLEESLVELETMDRFAGTGITVINRF